LLLTAANLSPAVAQGVPEMTIFSFDDDSCDAWTRSSDDKMSRVRCSAWFRGYVSGYNLGNPANQILLGGMPDPAAVIVFVDKFCRDNPSLSFIAAAIPMIRDHREISVPAPERKREPDSDQESLDRVTQAGEGKNSRRWPNALVPTKHPAYIGSLKSGPGLRRDRSVIARANLQSIGW
jgi:hypothetical protein